MVEQLIRNQQARGSNPRAGSNENKGLADKADPIYIFGYHTGYQNDWPLAHHNIINYQAFSGDSGQSVNFSGKGIGRVLPCLPLNRLSWSFSLGRFERNALGIRLCQGVGRVDRGGTEGTGKRTLYSH